MKTNHTQEKDEVNKSLKLHPQLAVAVDMAARLAGDIGFTAFTRQALVREALRVRKEMLEKGVPLTNATLKALDEAFIASQEIPPAPAKPATRPKKKPFAPQSGEKSPSA